MHTKLNIKKLVCKGNYLCILTILMALFATSAENTPSSVPKIVPAPSAIAPLLKKELNQIIQSSRISPKSLGMVVFNNNSGLTEFTLNANTLFIPASLSKIITASALLEYFHPFYQFETWFLATEPISSGGVLPGHLYLKGGGDPSFVSESLWNLVNHLKRTGLQVVQGDLILDDDWFDKTPSHFIKKFFSKDRSYNAPLSALSFNWNALNIYIQPGEKLQQPAQVFIDPENAYVTVSNQTKTTNGTKDVKISRVSAQNGKDVLYIKGSVPLHGKEFVVYRNISNPTKYTGYNAIEFLKQRNIHVTGDLKLQHTPPTATVLARHKGRTLSQLIQDMMKYSSNFIAEMLVTQLSMHKGKERGDLKDGMKWIRKFLNQKGIKRYVFQQPSGLSRQNKLTPNSILTILKEDFHSPYAYEKLAAYPLAGQEGTLKKRLKDVAHPSLIRAKTGRLLGVDGLAGYITSQGGDMRIFVFIYNGTPKKQEDARQLFDDLALALVNQ